jgi:hypothetical protein
MRIIALAFALCMLSGTAFAQECRSVPKASDRLACYDRIDPAIAQTKKSATPKSPATDQTQTIDGLAVENARLNKKIGNICRGC